MVLGILNHKRLAENFDTGQLWHGFDAQRPNKIIEAMSKGMVTEYFPYIGI